MDAFFKLAIDRSLPSLLFFTSLLFFSSLLLSLFSSSLCLYIFSLSLHLLFVFTSSLCLYIFSLSCLLLFTLAIDRSLPSLLRRRIQPLYIHVNTGSRGVVGRIRTRILMPLLHKQLRLGTMVGGFCRRSLSLARSLALSLSLSLSVIHILCVCV